MLRFLFLIAIFYVAYRVLKGVLLVRPKPREQKKSLPEAEAMVMDPICKTYIVQHQAIEYNGRHFCSEECRDKFINAPPS